MNKKCTILFLTRRFYPDIGGVENHVLNVSRELIKRGYRVIVVAESANVSSSLNKGGKKKNEAEWQTRYISDKTAGKGKKIDKSTKNLMSLVKTENSSRETEISQSQADLIKNIIVYRLPKVKENRLKKFYIWYWFFRNRRIITESDIVHCHDVFFWYLPMRLLFLLKPVFTTFHGYESFPIPMKNILIRKLSEKLSQGNICIGAYIQKWYGTKADYISYGGVESKLRVENGELKINKPKNNKIINILFVGRLENDTGIPIYLKALELLKKNNIPFQFEVIGDGSLRRDAERYGRAYGFTENTTDYIRKADLIFASSYLPILESLLQRKPVVAVYQNPLKEDYLKMTPFKDWIHIVNTEIYVYKYIIQYDPAQEFERNKINEAYLWAQKQTWGKLTDLYEKLWKT